MNKYKQKESFFYRLSNSEPDKLVFLHWKGEHISQQKTAMFESVEQFRHAMFRFKHLKPLVLPQADGSTHLQAGRDYLSIVSSPEFEIRISKEYLPFRKWYGGEKEESKHSSSSSSSSASMIGSPSPKSPSRRTHSNDRCLSPNNQTRATSSSAADHTSHMAQLTIEPPKAANGRRPSAQSRR